MVEHKLDRGRPGSQGKRRRKERTSIAQEYVLLESRQMLAANIELYDAYLVDGNLNEITSPAHGEKVGVMARWNTTDLPSGASYQIGFTVDGVLLQGGVTTAGAGSAAGNGFSWYHLGWFATGASQSVQVFADNLSTVAEANESDNTISFNFTSQAPDLPQKLIWPSPGDPYSDFVVTNYVDVDPLSGIKDYAGFGASYNGHNAFDAGPVQFREMDSGVPLFAAADGVVTFVNDGDFDRRTTWGSGDTGNGVIVEHGNGWRTIYWHFRRDSIRVKVGDTVTQGETLGFMGSSGTSTGLHVHFGLEHNGRTVEPMYAESDYFLTPFGNVFDNRYLVNSGITNYNPNNHLQEAPSELTTFSQASGQTAFVYGIFSGLRSGDQMQFRWVRPDGSIYTNQNWTISQNYSNSWWWGGVNLPALPPVGTWKAEMRANNVLLGTKTFEVTTSGLPEIRIQNAAGAIILDNRYTPIDFGTGTLGVPFLGQTFHVFNHGGSTLNLGALTLPAGYILIEGLPTTLAPGASDSFTVELNTATAGYKAGEIRLLTNDPDESVYTFSVEGYVSGASSKLVLGISERRVAEGTVIVGNVRRPTTSGSLTVNLSSGDSTEIQLPASVVIPNGEDYVSFEITTLSDGLLDGNQMTGVFASAVGYHTAANHLEVLDDLMVSALITSQFVYYKGSTFASGGVQAALDTTKSLARENGSTQTLGFSNLISTTRGINGLVFDVDNLASTSLTAADFVFQWSPQGGFDATTAANQPGNWDLTTVLPSLINVSTLSGVSSRIRLEWGDNQIQNRWLRVTLKGNANTGLATDNVFYIGHLLGEVSGLQSGNATTQPFQRFSITNIGDVSPIRANLGATALVSNLYDLNKNGTVQNLGDVTGVRSALGLQLTNIQIPGDAPRPSPSSKDDDGTKSGNDDVVRHYFGLPETHVDGNRRAGNTIRRMETDQNDPGPASYLSPMRNESIFSVAGVPRFMIEFENTESDVVRKKKQDSVFASGDFLVVDVEAL